MTSSLSSGPAAEAVAATAEAATRAVVVGLNAAIVSVWDEMPHVLVVRYAPELGLDVADQALGAVERPSEGLPFGPFEPLRHRTMDIGLRRWVEEQTALRLGYVEQLYTFGDRGRHATLVGTEPHVVSVGYLALTRRSTAPPGAGAFWSSWYRYLPWEDWREQPPAVIERVIAPLLRDWAARGETSDLRERRWERARLSFGFEGLAFHDENVLERYELLYEAGLVQEARRDRPDRHAQVAQHLKGFPADASALGAGMMYDHRRILATAMGRLRGKLKYRPVIFELMPPTFTLLELQRTIEAVSGTRLHKQNFRRLLARTGLVEPTGSISTKTGGRPAEQFRFRREVLRERPAPGVRLPLPRSPKV